MKDAPEVKFIYDESVAAQDRIEQIILEIHAEDAARTVDNPEVVGFSHSTKCEGGHGGRRQGRRHRED